MNWRERYAEAYRKHFNKKYPAAMATGYLKPKFPAVNTANGLTSMVVNFCKWMGHHDMERVNNTGNYREGKKHKSSIYAGGYIQEKGIWLPSEKGKGYADVSGGIRGKRVSIEIKIGKDRPSPEQLKRQELARADGNIYEFIKTPEDFFTLYDSLT